MAVACDNATSNNTFTTALKVKIADNIYGTDSSFTRVRCFCHIMNLAAQACLSVFDSGRRKAKEKISIDENEESPEEEVEVDLVEQVIEPDLELNDDDVALQSLLKPDQLEEEGCNESIVELLDMAKTTNLIVTVLRKALIKIKYSSSLKLILKQQQVIASLKPSKVILDVKTRWNSCYYMLRWAYKNRNALDATFGNSILRSLEIDWSTVEKLVTILSVIFKIF